MNWLVAAMGGSVLVVFACLVPGTAALLVAGRMAEWCRFVFRMCPVGLFYFAYTLLVRFSESRATWRSALANGESVEGLERHLHVAWEPFLSHHPLPWATGYYGWAQVLVTLGVLTWIALFEDDSFWRCGRNTLAIIAGVGFLCYWFIPTAPPRLLPLSYGVHSTSLGMVQSVADQLGAMPSLHTAWAGWAALVWWAIVPGRFRYLGFVNLAVTGVVVLTTGNHYLFDVLAGEVLSLGAAVAASRLEVWRLSRLEMKSLAVAVVLSDGVDEYVGPGW